VRIAHVGVSGGAGGVSVFPRSDLSGMHPGTIQAETADAEGEKGRCAAPSRIGEEGHSVDVDLGTRGTGRGFRRPRVPGHVAQDVSVRRSFIALVDLRARRPTLAASRARTIVWASCTRRRARAWISCTRQVVIRFVAVASHGVKVSTSGFHEGNPTVLQPRTEVRSPCRAVGLGER